MITTQQSDSRLRASRIAVWAAALVLAASMSCTSSPSEPPWGSGLGLGAGQNGQEDDAPAASDADTLSAVSDANPSDDPIAGEADEAQNDLSGDGPNDLPIQDLEADEEDENTDEGGHDVSVDDASSNDAAEGDDEAEDTVDDGADDVVDEDGNGADDGATTDEEPDSGEDSEADLPSGCASDEACIPEVTLGECQAAWCNPLSRECEVVEAGPETPCDDGDACTFSDLCAPDGCAGTAIPSCPGPLCSDGWCETPEDCESCAADCGECPPVSTCCYGTGVPGCDDRTCSDYVCGRDSYCCDEWWDEPCADQAKGWCEVCGGHTPECDDGWCQSPEDCSSCPQDCGVCPDPEDCCATHSQPLCGDPDCEVEVCNFEPACCAGPWRQDCVDMAKRVCVACGGEPPICGDRECTGPEDCRTCSTDCEPCL